MRFNPRPHLQQCWLRGSSCGLCQERGKLQKRAEPSEGPPARPHSLAEQPRRPQRTNIIAIIASGPAAVLTAVICARTAASASRASTSFNAARVCSRDSVGAGAGAPKDAMETLRTAKAGVTRLCHAARARWWRRQHVSGCLNYRGCNIYHYRGGDGEHARLLLLATVKDGKHAVALRCLPAAGGWPAAA